MREPEFRLIAKATVGANTVKTPSPPRYPCQAPQCTETSNTIACSRHLNMLPLHLQSLLTRAIATGEAGVYGPAMQEAMQFWTEES